MVIYIVMKGEKTLLEIIKKIHYWTKLLVESNIHLTINEMFDIHLKIEQLIKELHKELKE